MGGVVSGILIVSAVIAVGYFTARLRVLGPEVQGALTRTAFYVTNPALLFTVVAGSDIRAALGTDAPLALLSAAAVGLLYCLLSFLFFRRPVAETAVGAMASSYANANNIGIPVSLYAVGTAQHVAPVLLVQILVMAPFYLTVLGLAGGARISWKKLLIQPVANPMIIASGLGAAVALTGWSAPDLLQKPIDMLAGGAVPMVLLAFGLSRAGRAPLQKGDGRTGTLVATALKIAGMPVIVWALGRFVFGLEGQHLLASVIMAALPTAQNVFLFASPYGRGVTMARDVILCTTVLSAGALGVAEADPAVALLGGDFSEEENDFGHGLLAPGEDFRVADGDGERQPRGGKFYVADQINAGHGFSLEVLPGCTARHALIL